MRLLKRRSASWLTLASLTITLSACGPASVRQIPPAADKLSCADEPIATPGDATQYMKDLRASWFDCWNTVQWHKDWWAKQKP